MFDEAQNEDIERSVTLEELQSILKLFKRSKSLGPNGWPIELYLEFFNIIGEDIRKVLNEIKDKGIIIGSMNATFIALISKSSCPCSFNDFRPIALCNVIYKLKAKIIANRIKQSLSKGISSVQFGFLPRCVIFSMRLGLLKKVCTQLK